MKNPFFHNKFVILFEQVSDRSSINSQKNNIYHYLLHQLFFYTTYFLDKQTGEHNKSILTLQFYFSFYKLNTILTYKF